MVCAFLVLDVKDRSDSFEVKSTTYSGIPDSTDSQLPTIGQTINEAASVSTVLHKQTLNYSMLSERCLS